MRNWIDLFESFDDEDEEEHVPEDEFVREVRDVLDEHSAEADAETIKRVGASIRDAMNGETTIYRVMRLPIGWVYDLQEGMSLGQSWSLSIDCPIDNLYDRREHPNGFLHRLIATVTINDIALAHSTAFQILFPEEEEVFLNPTATVKLVRVDAIDDEIDLRPDLRGKSFRS